MELLAKKKKLKDIEKFKILYEKGLLKDNIQDNDSDRHNVTKIDIKKRDFDSDNEE